MFFKKNKDELTILDGRLIKAQEFCDELIAENRKLQQNLIRERNELFEETRSLELEKGLFETEKKNIFRIADMKTEHLEAELEFIKEHRMLPAECKFYSTKSKPSVMKKLKKK